MEMLFSATLGELAKISISFLIDKYLKQATPSKEERLQQMLLRVRITVEEAEGRRVTNQVMLRQLKMLKEGLYRGCYVLDTFRCRAHEEENGNDHEVSRPLSLSKFNPAKRVCIPASSRHGIKVLEQVLDSMEMIITGMNEFVVYVTNCPHMHHQPYSIYLLLEKCMFGRQVEMEMVINFLLQREPPGKGNVGVLPIVGPSKVGKSTLVEHVCCDERVRDHFSQIVFFNENEFGEEQLCTLRDGGIIKHQSSSALSEERLLVVLELDGDVDEGAWRRLYSASQRCFSPGSKIIITSRSDKVAKFGTTQAVSLNFLSREAYWYFFKVLLFGSSDPEQQPKLASMALEIFEEYFDYKMFNKFAGPFIDANKIARFLSANFDIQYWRRVLACIRETKQKNLVFRTCPGDSGMTGQPIYFMRIAKPTQYCIVYCHDRVGSAHKAVPKITLQETLAGSFTPQGKFEITLWKSHLPPYHNYIYSCEVRDTQCMGKTKRKKLGQKRKI